MTIENIAAGLKVLMDAGAKGPCVSAEHDVLYAGGQAELVLTREQMTEMQRLGWVWNVPYESWQAFT